MKRVIVACYINDTVPDIRFTDVSDTDDLDELLFELDQAGYNDYIVSQNDDGSIIEFYRNALEPMAEDKDLSKTSRKLVCKLLDKSDPDHQYIHVELGEAPTDAC